MSKAVQVFSEKFSFTGSIDVILFGTPEHFKSREFEGKLTRAGERMLALQNVDHIGSLATYLTYFRRAVGEPFSDGSSFRSSLSLARVFRVASRRKLITGYWRHDRLETRMNVRLTSISSSVLRETLIDVKRILKEENLDFKIGGFSQLRLTLLDIIVTSFLKSFGLSFVLIFLAFIFLFRSIKWSMIAMVPNLLPIIILIGAIAYLQIVVEDSVILTVSILIGIAVDDTIHFLFGIKNRLKNFGLEEAISETYAEVSPALIGTTLVLISTVPTFFLTEILMFYKMAGFIAFAMLIALLADIYLLPSLLRFEWRKKNVF